MPLLRSLPEQPVMRDLYKSQPATCKPLGELTEAYYARGCRRRVWR
jgi:hypothetical protein